MIMQRLALLGLLLAAACKGGDVTATTAAASHPIGKVITLLQTLMAKVKSEGQAEEVSFSAFMRWCTANFGEFSDAIKEEKDTIDTLSSTIDSKSKAVSLLSGDVSQLENEIKDLQVSDKEASDDDKARNKLYLDKEKDLKSTIAAIGDAVKALQSAATATDKKLLLSEQRLAQSRVRDIFALIATVASDSEQSSLMNFVQDEGDGKPLAGAGDSKKHVKTYSFKSNSVTELLKNLKLKFEDELIESTKAETNAANSYALSKQARGATLKAAETSKKQKEVDSADAQGALKTAQANLKDQNADLKADSGTLKATKTQCSMKKSEWRERSSIRAHELQAMAAGIKVLGKVSGVRTKAPSNAKLGSAPVKLIQILSQSDDAPPARAVQLLRATAKTYHSKALDTLANIISAHVPHQFQDVINRIQKMIFRLQQEQTDESNHKAWCDLELAKTKTSIGDKNGKVEELNAKIKEANANVVTLVSDIQAAQKMMADIKKFQMQSTMIRNRGKAENLLAMKDAASAQTAIAQAMSVLSSFYKDSGSIKKEPWEFLQVEAPGKLPKNPALWDSPYTGVTDPTKGSSGVIAVLEAVSADFSRMEAGTRAQEVTDASEYDATMKKHSIELSRRSKESDMKAAQKARLVSKIVNFNQQKKHVSHEMDATNQYLKDLKPACVSGDSTFEKRKAARDAEIKALQDAQGLLDSAFKAPVKFLQISRHGA